MFERTNKIALVTGGKRGMGRTHSLALAGQGAKVVVSELYLLILIIPAKLYNHY